MKNIGGIILTCVLIIGVYFLVRSYLTANLKEPLGDISRNGTSGISGSKLADYTGLDAGIKLTTLKGPTLALPYDPRPTKPGCWYIYPTGCTKGNHKAHSWMEDSWGYKNLNPPSNSSADACTKRQSSLISYCGNKDIETSFVPSGAWTECAKEDGTCEGTGLVRFGLDPDKWIYKNSTGSIGCNNQTFGKDPAYGHAKTCYLQGTGPAVAPAPAPATVHPKCVHNGPKIRAMCGSVVKKTYTTWLPGEDAHNKTQIGNCNNNARLGHYGTCSEIEIAEAKNMFDVGNGTGSQPKSWFSKNGGSCKTTACRLGPPAPRGQCPPNMKGIGCSGGVPDNCPIPGYAGCTPNY